MTTTISINDINSERMLLNLTPHSLTLHGVGGVVTVLPSGTIARLAVTREIMSTVVIDGISLSVARAKLGSVTGLPAPVAGIVYVVSALVADAVKRADVLSPGELVRDGAGVVTGANGLTAYTP